MEPGVDSPPQPAPPQPAETQIAQALIAELRWIDGELARLDQARARLIHRRMVVLAELTSQPVPTQPAPAKQEPAAARPELSGRTVARALLAVGAVLVIIAAAAFTVANWSSIGPLGRSAVLFGVTAAVLAAPWPLVRRGLTATAESVAVIGLALTIADAYLVGQLIEAGPSPFGIAAGSAALAAAWLCYGRVVRLRAPWLGAIAMAQLPGLYLAAGIAHAAAIPLALCLTAGADLLLGYRTSRLATRAESRTCLLAAGLAWIAGIGLAALQAATASTVAAACWPAAAFAAAALAGIALWPRVAVPRSSAGPVAAISGFLLTGIALPVAVALPAGWPAVALAATGLGLSALAFRFRNSASADVGIRLDLAAAGAVAMLGLTGLAVLPAALGELGGPRYGWPAMIVLALVSLACWLAPVRGGRCAGVATAALSFASVPTALGATGVSRLAILTAGAAGLACWAALRTKDTSRALVSTAVVAATALATCAALWSTAGYASAEFAVLTVIFGIAATARNDITALISTGAALAAATGLAFAAPLEAHWPAGQAAFAAVAVATVAIVVATLLRKRRPAQALVLDLGAGPIVVLAAIVAGQAGTAPADTFAAVTVTAAVLASATSWLRSGRRRFVALAATGCAALAAVGAEWRPLTQPWSVANPPWHGQPLIGTGATTGLPFAVAVLAIGLAAIVTAAGALRGSSRGSLDAVAVALPLVAGPALLAGGLGYSIVLGCLLVLAVGLTGWAALGGSMAPVGGAIVATSLAVAWALAAITPTLIVLGCLGAAYLVCAWRCPRVRTVMAGLSALAFEAAWCAVLAALGVTVVEAYTIPAAAIVLVFGWRLATASWPAFGPGLVLLLLPSLIATSGPGWIRPALLGVAAVAVTLIGAKQRLQAPLVLGVIVAITDAGYQLTRVRLTELVPGWVPIAICGIALLWTGATYEARLRNLASIRRAFTSLR